MFAGGRPGSEHHARAIIVRVRSNRTGQLLWAFAAVLVPQSTMTVSPHVSLSRLVCWLLLSAACAGAPHQDPGPIAASGGFLLQLDTAPEVRRLLEAIEANVEVASPGAEWKRALTVFYPNDSGELHDDASWPFQLPSFPLFRHGDDVDIRITAFDRDGDVLVVQRAFLTIVGNRNLFVAITLEDECLGQGAACEDADCYGESCDVCRAGRCEPSGRSASTRTR